MRMCNHRLNKFSQSSSAKSYPSTTHVALVLLGLVLVCQHNDNGSVQCLEAVSN